MSTDTRLHKLFLISVLIVLLLPIIMVDDLDNRQVRLVLEDAPARQYAISTDYNVEIAADSDDDTWWYNETLGWTHKSDRTEIIAMNKTSGIYWGEWYGNMRWQLNIPQGATITFANFSGWIINGWDSPTNTGWMKRIDETNVGSLEGDSSKPDTVDTNKVYIEWEGGSNRWMHLDVIDLIQDQVNLAGWQSGYYIGLEHTPVSPTVGAWDSWEDYQHAESRHTYLNITYTSPAYDYVDQISNEDGQADVGTHSSFTDQQSAPDSTYDTLTEGSEYQSGNFIYTYGTAIAADTDDDYWNFHENTWTHVTTGTDIYIREYNVTGKDIGEDVGQFRFQLNIPQYVVIHYASITVYETIDEIAVGAYIRRIDETNVGSLEGDSQIPSVTKTHEVIHIFDVTSSEWRTTDITDIVQDQVNLAGWVSGYYIGLQFNLTGGHADEGGHASAADQRFEDYSAAGSNEAYINVTYSVRSFWLQDWKRRINHVVEQTIGAGVDYTLPLRISLDGGTSYNNTLYLNGNAQNDFDDIRFTYNNGSRLLDFNMSATYGPSYPNWFQNKSVDFWAYEHNYPAAWYYNGRTYVVMQADAEESGLYYPDIYAMYYDHENDVWSGLYYVSYNPSYFLEWPEDHGAPCMWVNNEGYIHVIYGAHDYNLKHAVSKYPEDLSEWELWDDLWTGQENRPSYPHIGYDPATDYVYMTYRSSYISPDSDPQGYINSTDGGRTWSESQIILTSSSNMWCAYPGQSEFDPDTKMFHYGYRFWNITAAQYQGIFYVALNVTTGHIFNATGHDLGTSTTLWDTDLLVYDNAPNYYSLYGPSTHIDATTGNVYIIYAEDLGALEYAYFTFFNQSTSSWSSPVQICEQWAALGGDFIVHSDTSLTAFLTDTGYNIDRYTWDGASWSLAENNVVTSGYLLACVLVPINYVDEIQFVCSEYLWEPEQYMPVYAWGTSGLVNGTARKWAKFYVKIPVNLSEQSFALYVYYDNSDATSASQSFSTSESPWVSRTRWGAEEYEYQYFTLWASDIDSSSDIGTASNPENAQDIDPDTDYMTLQEGNTDPDPTDTEDNYDSNQSDQDSSADIGTESDPSYANDSVNSQYMNLQESDQGLAAVDESDYVTVVAGTLTDWTVTGTAPYLQEGLGDGNYSTCTKGGGESYWWQFGDTSETGSGFTVTLYVYISGGDGNDDMNWGVDWTNDGVSDATGQWTDPTTGWYDTGTITGLDTAAEYNSARMYLQGIASAGYIDPDIDAAYIRIEKAAQPNYMLDFEYSWSAADYDETYENVSIYVQTATQGGETLQAWEWTGSDWSSLGAIDIDTWNNFSVTYLTGSNFYILINDTDQSDDTTQNNWNIDLITLHVWSDPTYNYEMDMEYQWTHANYDENNETLCIYVDVGASENLTVWEWDGGSWSSLGEINSTNTIWHNYTISYLTDGTYTIRLLGDVESGDTTQNLWQIDVIIIYTNITVTGQIAIYRLDLEEQWTAADYDEGTELLCIKWGSISDEQVDIYVWYSSTWYYLSSITTANASSWTNISVTTYLTASTFTIRFGDNTTSIDETQSTWQKDSCLLWTYPAPPEVSTPYVANADGDQTDNLFAKRRDYQLVVNITDGDGADSILYANFTLLSNDQVTEYWAVMYNQTEDSFTEYDPDGYIDLNTTASSNVTSGTSLDITFIIEISWDHPDFVNADSRVYAIDSGDDDVTQYDEVNLDFETRLSPRSDIGLDIDDGSGTADRGELDSTGVIDVSGSWAYRWTDVGWDGGYVFAPTDEIDVWVYAEEVATSPWEATNYESGSGTWSIYVDADDVVGEVVYHTKPVEEGAGAGGTGLWYGIGYGQNYIADQLNITITADETNPINDQQVNFTLTVEYDYDDTTCTTYTIQIARNASSWYTFVNGNKTFFNDTSSDTAYLYNATSDGDGVYETTHGLSISNVFLTNTETVIWGAGENYKYLYDAIGVADTVYVVFDAVRTFYEAVGIADVVYTVASFVMALFEALGVAATILASKLAEKLMHESIGLADSIATIFSASRTLYESVGLADIIATSLAASRALFESIGISDIVATAFNASRNFYDSVGIADSVAKTIGKRLEEAVGIADTAAWVADYARTLFESLGLADVEYLTASFSKMFYESIGLADVETLTATVVKQLFEAAGLADVESLATSFSRALYESVGIADVESLIASFSRVLFEAVGIADIELLAASFSRIFYDAIGLADVESLEVTVVKTLYEAVGLADSESLVASFSRVFHDVIGIADVDLLTASFSRMFYEAIGVADMEIVVASFSKALFDAIGVSDSIVKTVGKVLEEAIGLADIEVLTLSISKALFEAIGLADVESIAAGFSKVFYENLGLADTVDLQLIMTKFLYESIGLADVEAIVASFSRTLYEDIGISDVIHTAAALSRTWFEAIGIADTEHLVATFSRVFYDSIGLADTEDLQIVITKFLYEAVGFADVESLTVSFSRALYESIGIAEVEAFVSTFSRAFYESIGLADVELVGASFIRTFFDTIGIADTVDNQIVIQKILYEAVGITAVVTTAYAASRTFGENIGIGDGILNTLSFSRTFFEDIGLSDVTANSMAAAKTLFDSIGLADYIYNTPTFGGDAYEKYLFESIGLADAIATVLVASRTFYEAIGIADDISTQFVGLWHLFIFEAFRFIENDVWAPYRAAPGGPISTKPITEVAPTPIVDAIMLIPQWMWGCLVVIVLGVSAYRVYVIREEHFFDLWYNKLERWLQTLERWIEEFLGVE